MNVASRFLRVTSPPMEGPDVEAAQRRLIALKFYTGSFNGIYDTATAQAVIAFQQASGLRPDGIVGPATWTALGLPNVEWGGGMYRINVDTQRNILNVFTSGRLTGSYPVATGKPTTPTPIGDYLVIEKMPNPGGSFGAAWLRLSIPNGGYAIHGNDNPASIGVSCSHGCVRMRNEDVTTLYNLIPVGTLVNIMGALATTRILRVGVAPGNDVMEIQRMLKTLGYYKGDLDGHYGPQSSAAVQQFQRDAKLTVDGIVGHETSVQLQAHYDIALGDVQP